jgi:undecaprenyl-diphosphatase
VWWIGLSGYRPPEAEESFLITYFEAIAIGAIQGVTELFPISSLGQAVVVPTIFGWDRLVEAQSRPESFYLAFLVGLHVATATALLIYFRAEWSGIVRAFFATLGAGVRRRTAPWSAAGSADERMAWLLFVATIPAGVSGLAFEHVLRVTFAKPLFAAVFLMVNGVLLLVGERFRRRAEVKAVAVAHGTYEDSEFRRLETLEFKEAAIVGIAQTLALIPGISRSGITMVAGLVRGLSHEDAARFSFLLATPIILAAGLYKLPDLFGALGQGIRGQVFVGSLVAGVVAYLTVRFLMKYFETRTLTPFAVFCLVEGALCTIGFALTGHTF